MSFNRIVKKIMKKDKQLVQGNCNLDQLIAKGKQ